MFVPVITQYMFKVSFRQQQGNTLNCAQWTRVFVDISFRWYIAILVIATHCGLCNIAIWKLMRILTKYNINIGVGNAIQNTRFMTSHFCCCFYNSFIIRLQPDLLLKAESRHFGMISASWNHKHISILYVYFQAIIASLGISTPHHYWENTFWYPLGIVASGWNVAPFQTKWKIPFVPLSSDFWIFGRSAVLNHKYAD